MSKYVNIPPKNLLQRDKCLSKAINALRENKPLMQRWRNYNQYKNQAKQI